MNEEHIVEIAYTDIWEITKDIDKSLRLRVRLAFLTTFLLELLSKSVLTFVLHAIIMSLLGMFNLNISLLFSISISWMNLVAYGTGVMTDEHYRRLFGNKKYELPEPINEAWELVFVILASALSSIALFPLL